MSEAAAGLDHAAVFYETADEYCAAVLTFVDAGLHDGEPVFVAVPAAKLRLLRGAAGLSERVVLADMTHMGANPAWIIPRVQAFIDANPGRPVRYVGEPIWETRSPEELAEAMRHEALINLAFSGAPASILCPYDAARLDQAMIDGAEQTHPVLVRGGSREPSAAYAGPASFPSGSDEPLPEPPATAAELTYRHAPAEVRAFVRDRAQRAGLSGGRIADLVIAVGELAANTLRHTRSDGRVLVWATPAEVICEVRDTGWIRDPLAGRLRPRPDGGRGHGLWVVHQLCDLVELRTGSSGSTVRLHMRLGS